MQIPIVDKQKNRYRKFKLIELNGNKGCECCGYIKNIGALEFHHVIPSTKKFPLDARNLSNRGWNSILEEFNKCIILCANCHREHHNPELLFIDRNSYTERPDNEKTITKCLDCDKNITSGSIRCELCNKIYSRKVIRPSLDTLLEDLATNSYVSVGKKYGVSDNAIRKWLKSKNLS